MAGPEIATVAGGIPERRVLRSADRLIGTATDHPESAIRREGHRLLVTHCSLRCLLLDTRYPPICTVNGRERVVAVSIRIGAICVRHVCGRHGSRTGSYREADALPVHAVTREPWPGVVAGAGVGAVAGLVGVVGWHTAHGRIARWVPAARQATMAVPEQDSHHLVRRRTAWPGCGRAAGPAARITGKPRRPFAPQR
jgi:hypothetical protein